MCCEFTLRLLYTGCLCSSDSTSERCSNKDVAVSTLRLKMVAIDHCSSNYGSQTTCWVATRWVVKISNASSWNLTIYGVPSWKLEQPFPSSQGLSKSKPISGELWSAQKSPAPIVVAGNGGTVLALCMEGPPESRPDHSTLRVSQPYRPGSACYCFCCCQSCLLHELQSEWAAGLILGSLTFTFTLLSSGCHFSGWGRWVAPPPPRELLWLPGTAW